MVQNIKFVRRGGIYCARRRVSEANRRAAAALRPEIPPGEPRAAAVRADMESAPTRVCNTAGLWFLVWPGALPSSVGAGFIPPGDPRAAARFPDDASIVPYRGCDNAGRRPSRLVQNIKYIRRGGIYPARDPRAAARFPGRCKHRPLQGLQRRKAGGHPGWPGVCRGL